MNINLLLPLIAIVWLSSLSIFIGWFYLRLKTLIKDSKNKDFINTFKNIEELQQKNLRDILGLSKDLKDYKNISLGHFSKMGLIKFNPFAETGGNNSFSLVLLDGNKNGIIITSLHSRERTRLYLKEVKLGKTDIELSQDEVKALTKATK